MLSALTLTSILLLPGAAIVLLLRRGGNFFILSIGLSYAVFIVNAYFSSKFSDFASIEVLYFLEFLIAIAVILRKNLLFARTEFALGSNVVWLYRLLLSGLLASYLLFVGPYLEVPADVWQHLRTVRDYVTALEHGHINLSSPWHLLYGFSVQITGEDLLQTTAPVSATVSLIFGLGIFEIAREIASGRGWSEPRSLNFALLASLLTCILFGTSVFAFFRYYALAPVFINFLFFLYAAVLICDTKKTIGHLERVLSFALCFLLAWLIHRQEALFLACFILVMTSYFLVFRVIGLGKFQARLGETARIRFAWPVVVGLWLLVSVMMLVLAEFFTESGREVLAPLSNNTLMFSLWTDRSWIIADPLGRVFETIGGVGIVFALAYFSLSSKNSRPLVITGLVITPFLFLFNPIFIKWFLTNASQDVVWRLTYMVPIGLVAAYVINMLWDRRYAGYWAKTLLLLQLGLLVPIPGLEKVQHLRWLTLREIPVGNSSALWSDLVQKLGELNPRNVLTDPISGYVIDGATVHTVAGFKFHGSGKFIPINYNGYGPASFEGFKSWLFVANYRDGEWSEVGARSGHWQGNVMYVRENYSDKLQAFLSNPPKHFHLLWEKDDIKLFEIDASRDVKE